MRIPILLAAVVSVLFVLSTAATGQDNFGPGGSVGHGPPDYSPEDLRDTMNSLSPGAGDSFVDDYNNGGFHFGELVSPPSVNGAADADTILIDSKYNDGSPKNDLITCADTAIHEHKHWKNSQGSPTGEDPTTTDPLCGGCNHASMHMERLVFYIEKACDDESNTIDYCELARDNLYAAGEQVISCSPECSSYDGTDSSLVALEGALQQCCD
jgi:hypothetical protein